MVNISYLEDLREARKKSFRVVVSVLFVILDEGRRHMRDQALNSISPQISQSFVP